MFGRDLRLYNHDYTPNVDFVRVLDAGTSFDTDPAEHLATMDEMRLTAINKLIHDQDLRVRSKSYAPGSWNVGDLVLLRNYKRDKKLDPKLSPDWLGPYLISDISWHKASVRLTTLEGIPIKARHSVANIKKWIGREDIQGSNFNDNGWDYEGEEILVVRWDGMKEFVFRE